MAWVRLDDAMPHHPKVMAAGAEAFALDVAGIAYSNRFGTDGFIGDDMLPAVLPCLRSPRKAATRLCMVSRWFRDDERGGWLIHDVADYQPSAAEQEAERAKARERMRRLRAGNRSGEQDANVRANKGRSSEEVRDPVPSRPSVPTEQQEPTSPPEGVDPDVSDEARRLTRVFALAVKGNGHPVPKADTTAQRTWLVEMHRLLKIGPPGWDGDPPTPAEVEQVIAWATADDFERANVQAVPKFRKRYSALRLKALNVKGPKGPTRPPSGDVDYTAGWGRQEARS